jgi:hypothetical protein
MEPPSTGQDEPMTTRHLGRVPASALGTAARRCFGSTTLSSVRASGFASVFCLVKTEGVIVVAAVALALSSGWASAQAPLKPELERAAEARALVQACRELRPELAEHIDQAFEDWWVRDSEVADAVHVLYFGTLSPEQDARRQAFEALQERLLVEAERSRTSDPEAFAERCRRFIERLESAASPEQLESSNARGEIA